MDADNSELKQELERLSLPSEQHESLSFCETSVESLRLYLDNLPHASPAELCHRLYQMLPEIAGLQEHAGRKLALLELVKPKAFDCVQRLTRNLAVTPATTKVVSLSIAMLRYLAQGYKSVLTTSLRHPAPPANIVLDSLYAATTVHSQMLMVCWECYLAPPRRLWLELHTLYNIARIRNLDSVSLRSLKASNHAETTPRAAYVKPLLIACADPFRYTPQDLRTIAGFLTNAGNLVEFVGELQEGIFIVDARSDKGPLYSFKVEGVTRDHFRLRTRRLVQHIEDQLKEGELTGLNERLARELCHYWSREVRRLDNPEPDDTPVEIIFGLTHIHRELTGTHNVEEYIQSLRHGNPSRWLELEVEEKDEKHKDMFLQRTDPKIVEERKADPIDYTPARQGRKDTSSRRYQGQRINRSENGAGIEFSAPAENLTAGELVAIKAEGESDWQVGLVRWTRVTPRLMRVVGVQLFLSEMKPCAASMATESGRPASAQNGWSASDYDMRSTDLARDEIQPRVFPALRLDGEKRIVLTSLPFREYTTIQLFSPSGIERCRLLNAEEATYHISCFNLKELSQH